MEAIKDDGLQAALDHCDKRIEHGDEIEQDFFKMIKRGLLSEDNNEMLEIGLEILSKYEVKK